MWVPVRLLVVLLVVMLMWVLVLAMVLLQKLGPVRQRTKEQMLMPLLQVHWTEGVSPPYRRVSWQGT